MTDHHGPRWQGGPWAGQRGFGSASGRRFRRGALIGLLMIVLLVAALATMVASVIAGNAPAPGITFVVSAVVVVGLIMSARWMWRSTRAVGALMDAADLVADGDYSARVDDRAVTRQLGRLTRAFNAMTERLETNEDRRRELLADVAHELRSPLQVIRGGVEGMLDGLYPAEPERLRPLLEETIVMARLLDDLQTLSMAEAGVLPLHREAVDPRSVADDAVDAYRSIAEEAGVTLEAECISDTPVELDADPVRLAEILANLVTNAVRHTPDGGRVTVRVSATGGGVAFEVRDTGPGIPEDQLPIVFDRFVTSADTGGTGLGLAIAKRLVEAHGGTIEARSGANEGTAIRFTIPIGERDPRG